MNKPNFKDGDIVSFDIGEGLQGTGIIRGKSSEHIIIRLH